MADRAVALAVAFAAGFAFAVEVRAAQERMPVSAANAILCPSGTWVAQRYDRRRWNERTQEYEFVRTRWVRRCA
jgi:hypothetical protein